MIRSFFARTLSVSALAAAALAAPACADTPASVPAFTPTLSLSAQADAQVEPDFAQISSGVVTRGETARQALAENSELMDGVFAALRAAGVDRENMQTSQLSVSPVYSERRNNEPYVREIVGYEARNTVTAKIEDLDRLGRAIDAMAGAGANNIHGISFGVEDTEEAMDAARREAVARLMARASLYADAAGFELCGILRMNEGGQRPMPVRYEAADMMMASAARASTPIAAGELTLTAMVSADFCISQE